MANPQTSEVADDLAIKSSMSWRQFKGVEDIENGDIQATVVEFLGNLQDMETEIVNGMDEINRNKELNDLGRARRVRQLAIGTLQTRLDEARTNVESMERGRARIEREIDAEDRDNDTDPQVQAVREWEIRASLQGKPQGEILRMLEAAVEDGDTEFLHAVERAPRRLAPTDPDVIQRFREQRLTEQHPERMSRHRDWGTALEILRTVVGALENRIEKVNGKLRSIPGAEVIPTDKAA